jgi:hypothetical protein
MIVIKCLGIIDRAWITYLNQLYFVNSLSVCDLDRTLEAFGYTKQRSKGSHHTFSHPNGKTGVLALVILLPDCQRNLHSRPIELLYHKEKPAAYGISCLSNDWIVKTPSPSSI